jgi:mono/diheme cytochrome c family protein
MLLTPLLLSAALVLAGTNAAEPVGGRPAAVDFQRDIRPIFAEYCLACHGPDTRDRQAELRLDSPAALRHDGAIRPGDSARSQLVARIVSSDPEFVMPPPKTGKKPSPAQVATIRRWIDEGADWPQHWAFQPIERPPPVPVRIASLWPKSPIDVYLLQSMQAAELQPSPPAADAVLLRRAALDLTGLPPADELQLPDDRETAPSENDDRFERLIDRLLASPHYGERMAVPWLDLARYGDSDGYHDDTPRVIYQFRDYVIRSFNQDKPFDQFTIEQLAGDLLPDASLEQRIGSAFHRLGPTSSEGGADAAEYQAKYAVDRVNTTATTWLGVTLQCSECHDHKYDPFTTREYYQLFAFFNQVPEDILFRGNDAPPILATPDAGQLARREDLRRQHQDLTEELDARLAEPNAELDADQPDWERRLARGEFASAQLSPWQAIGPFNEVAGSQPFDYAYPPERQVDLNMAYDDGKLRWQPKPEWVDGKAHYLAGDKCATYLFRTVRVDRRQPLTLYLGSDDGIKVWINGKLVHSNILVRVVAPNQDRVPIVLQPGENQILLKIVNLQGGYGFYFSTREKDKDDRIEEAMRLARIADEQRTPEQRRTLRKLFLSQYDPRIGDLAASLADVEQQQLLLERSIPKLRIMGEVTPPRPTHILVRGDYRVPGEPVEPGVPAVLGNISDGGRANRQTLAGWLVDRRHPLTARVAMNRLWQQIYGQGLTRTMNDFGVRGEPPSHPELLDWLAAEFIDSGWDLKRMVRRLTLSSAYRQSSAVSHQALQRDPENRWLARAPRIRLPAELLRDQALAASGLLVRRVGGPSVKPYQPGDLWREMAYGDQPDRAYQQDHGENLYRRGLYTFWKRSIHYPMFALFDAPNREVCVAQRPVTNTPLQALVLLNDPTFVESARVLGQRILLDHPDNFELRLSVATRALLGRAPDAAELSVLRDTWTRLLDHYRAHLADAMAITQVGEFPRVAGLEVTELAAWTGVCQSLMNLDEALSRE